jgi:hypothetical protein
VLNRHVDKWTDGAVSIERPWAHGNKFIVGVHGPRDWCVRMHRHWLHLPGQREYRERVRRELRGRDLVCVCAPMPCHGDALIEVANGEEGL